jgi:hypothetical protein
MMWEKDPPTLLPSCALCYSGISRSGPLALLPSPLLYSWSCPDVARRAAPFHLPPPATANHRVRPPNPFYPSPSSPSPPSSSSLSPSSSSSSSSPMVTFHVVSSSRLLPSSLPSSSISKFVPLRGTNSHRRLAWAHPGTGNPSSVFSV